MGPAPRRPEAAAPRSRGAASTIWTQRGLLRLQDDGRLVVSPELAPPQDPSVATLMTPAAEQAGILGELLQTRSFLREVAARTSLAIPAQPSEERKFLDDMSKRFMTMLPSQ